MIIFILLITFMYTSLQNYTLFVLNAALLAVACILLPLFLFSPVLRKEESAGWNKVWENVGIVCKCTKLNFIIYFKTYNLLL